MVDNRQVRSPLARLRPLATLPERRSLKIEPKLIFSNQDWSR
ncbi:hypothetical protein [Moorena sp. SIO3H5]|nr:hypothetical protein [Moorena sp. SIO3H5]